MVQVTYDLAGFTSDLDAVVAEAGQDLHTLVRRGKPLLERLLADMRWLSPRFAEPGEGNSVQYLLHKDPADAYSVVAVVFRENYSTTVHDHTTWGLIGLWRGQEREERFKRVDDRSRPDYAQLRPAGTVLNEPGSVAWLVPPDEEIHRIRNMSPYPSCSIHVYGGDLSGKLRHQFDLETGAVRDFQITVKVLD
jgi:predicted metal-dependent enzyme (double-stranded beta helix superfamily)